jgi:magnesium transporter
MSTTIKEKKYDGFTWVDIHTQAPTKEEIANIASTYKLDFFQVKDSVQQGHLPKYEKARDCTFLILRACTAKNGDRVTSVRELSNKLALFYTETQIITIHGEDFEFVKNVYEHSSHKTIEELLLALVYQVLDTYEAPASVLSDMVDKLEAEILLRNYKTISLEDIYFQKTHTRISKNILLLDQNVIGHIQSSEENNSTLQDIKDKLLNLVLMYDEVSENSVNLLNTYISVGTQKSNDTMRLLTIFSAFFLPLTFIVGIYGMNFHYMPELDWHYGYLAAMFLMVGVSLGIYIWFKKKRIL